MPEYESKLIFQKKFNDLLRDQDVTQKEIANICGVSTSTVSTWSQGLNMPRMDKIEILANHFGLPKSYFIEHESHDIDFDDFTYAMHNETKNLSKESKERLLQMARFFSEEERKKGGN